jgi:hypothetical protein
LVLFFKKEQNFFFEKKKQKTFANSGTHQAGHGRGLGAAGERGQKSGAA